MSDLRLEKDSMGPLEVPASALYGASTQRAVENFPISGEPVAPSLIHAYGLIKKAAALTNAELGQLPEELGQLIAKAADEVAKGEHDDHFPVDVYQTGSGTSTNMNVNEVIANRCSLLAGEPLASRSPAHPNDHINLGQSSNDTFPTAMHLAAASEIKNDLLPALRGLFEALERKAEEFYPVLKIGRTHLMDATPLRLGQEFSGYAQQAKNAIQRAESALTATLEIPLGGTAIGTGLNRHQDFPELAIQKLREDTGLDLRRATNPFEAQASRDGLVEAHGHLNTIATSLFKVANDLRLLGSGPRCSIGEIALPATQPGSSIMPGKVNPVMCEAVTMVAARVFGNQNTVTWAGANGHFELNVFMPVMAKALLESIKLLAGVSRAFTEKCVSGLTAQKDRCEELIEQSLSMVTSLVPAIGYDLASQVAKESVATGRTVRELCLERLEEFSLTKEELEAALDPATMAGTQ